MYAALRCLLVGALLVGGPTVLPAQPAHGLPAAQEGLPPRLEELSRGALLRVSAPTIQARPLVGRLQALSPEAVELRRSGSGSVQVQRIPHSSIARIEVSSGRKGGGPAIGAISGLGAALLAGLALASTCDDGFIFTPSDCMRIGTVVFGIPAVILGAVLGGALSPERWQEVLRD
jgi:hypothetical protein